MAVLRVKMISVQILHCQQVGIKWEQPHIQEVVSTDFVGSRHAGVVDAEATIANDNRVVLYVWYDNEFGYSCQVVRVMEEMAGVNPPAFPR